MGPGADPACGVQSLGFNEAAGADPADAVAKFAWPLQSARGQTRMLQASMRPRGQTPRMRTAQVAVGLPWLCEATRGGDDFAFNEAAGADPADASPDDRLG